MTLNPKALEAAARALIRADAEELLSKPTIENTARAITAYLAALPPPAEAGELVERLRVKYVALGRTGPGDHIVLAEREEAADLIQSLSARLETVTRERGEFERRVGASEALTGMLDVRLKVLEAALAIARPYVLVGIYVSATEEDARADLARVDAALTQKEAP